jgi:hypothetical protein
MLLLGMIGLTNNLPAPVSSPPRVTQSRCRGWEELASPSWLI